MALRIARAAGRVSERFFIFGFLKVKSLIPYLHRHEARAGLIHVKAAIGGGGPAVLVDAQDNRAGLDLRDEFLHAVLLFVKVKL